MHQTMFVAKPPPDLARQPEFGTASVKRRRPENHGHGGYSNDHSIIDIAVIILSLQFQTEAINHNLAILRCNTG